MTAKATNLRNTAVSATTKMREYYIVDKYLGGLIKVERFLYREQIGQKVDICIPDISQYDNIYINGVEYTPTPSSQASKEGKEALCIESWYKCEFYVQGALPGIVDSICSLPHRMSNLSLAMLTDLASTDPDTNTNSRRPSDE